VPCQVIGRKEATGTSRGIIEEKGLAKGQVAALVA